MTTSIWGPCCYSSFTITNVFSCWLRLPLFSCTPWVFYALKSSTIWLIITVDHVWLPVGGTTLATSGTQLVCVHSEASLARRFHLNDASLFLITANFLANEHQLSQWFLLFLTQIQSLVAKATKFSCFQRLKQFLLVLLYLTQEFTFLCFLSSGLTGVTTLGPKLYFT